MTILHDEQFQSCERKRCYETQAEARVRAFALEDSLGLPMEAYRCRYCEFWHVAHKVSPARLAKVRRKMAQR
jgi:hypothetical protein